VSNLARTFALFGLALMVACSDEGPVSGPGSLTATLVGPEGADGAAILVLVGEGVGEVAQVGTTEVQARRDGDAMRLVLVSEEGGTLSFRVAVADTTQPPQVVIEQVAGDDDELRSVDGYAVEFVR
jgi:hypothetical protein